MNDYKMHVTERGPWTIVQNPKTKLHGVFIQSDDFTHDVQLYMTGDFENKAQELAHAQEIVKRLNSYTKE